MWMPHVRRNIRFPRAAISLSAYFLMNAEV